jgi:hypothetical protein
MQKKQMLVLIDIRTNDTHGNSKTRQLVRQALYGWKSYGIDDLDFIIDDIETIYIWEDRSWKP